MAKTVTRECEGCDNVIETTKLTNSEFQEYTEKGGHQTFKDGFCSTCKAVGAKSTDGTTKSK